MYANAAAQVDGFIKTPLFSTFAHLNKLRSILLQ